MKEKERRTDMLELRRVKKSYDGVTILEDINLKIQDGEIVSILGPSGCGKTTLLNLVLGLTPADQGQIIFDGKGYYKRTNGSKRIQYRIPGLRTFPEPECL